MGEVCSAEVTELQDIQFVCLFSLARDVSLAAIDYFSACRMELVSWTAAFCAKSAKKIQSPSVCRTQLSHTVSW